MAAQRFYIKQQSSAGAISRFSVLAKDHADALAQAEKITREKILLICKESRLDIAAYRTGRFIVRTLRIAAGLAAAVLAWIVADGPDISDTPFAQLTLGMLFGALFRVGAGLLIAVIAFHVAFGEGPERDLRPSSW